jgi:hypothetical protein
VEFPVPNIVMLWVRRIGVVALGAVGGYAYYYFIGCTTSCAITSNPWMSAAYGAFIGALVAPWTTNSKHQPREKE